MAKLSSSDIARAIRQWRTVLWEVTRLHPDYRADLSRLTEQWEVESQKPPFGVFAYKYRRRIAAAKRAYDRYKRLKRIASRLQSGRARSDEQIRLLRAAILRNVHVGVRAGIQLVDSVRRRYVSETPSEEQLVLPELREFATKWGLAFPLPWDLSLPPEMDIDLFTTPAFQPVKIISENRNRIMLELPPGTVSNQITIAMAQGAVRNALGTSKSETGRAVSRKPLISDKLRVKKRRNGRWVLTIPLPVDIGAVGSFLRAELPPSEIKPKELEELLEVGRRFNELQSVISSEKEIIKRIASEMFRDRLVGGASETSMAARVRLTRQRLREFRKLQRVLTGIKGY